MNRYRNIPMVTSILIAINVIVFVATYLVSSFAGLYDTGVLSAEALSQGRYWTLITSMFLHGGLIHILCNMVSLYYLGTFSEIVFGKGKFLAIYFIAGIAGGILYCAVAVMTGNPAGAVGASGAIFGLFGAYGYILFREYKNNKILMMSPSKGDITSFLTLLAINIFFGLSTPGIANEAHIGGLIAGFVMAAIIYPQITKRR